MSKQDGGSAFPIKEYEYSPQSWHVYYKTVKAAYTEAGLQITDRQVKDALYAYITPIKLEDYISSLNIAPKTD